MRATNPHRTRRAASSAILMAALLALPAAGSAETTPAQPGEVEPGSTPQAADEPPAANKGRLSFGFGMDFTTAYFFRGIQQERDGFIWQPYGGISVTLYEGAEGDFINSASFDLGSWNSVQSEQTLASGSGPGNWYESDITTGFSLGLVKLLSANVTYIAYTYPNGSFATVQELDAGLSLDDSEWLGPFALQPSMVWAFEVDNTAFGGNEGIYLQLGAKPSVVLFEEAEYPLTLALPLTVGLSVSDYYEEGPGGDNDTFGYFDGGLVASVPLAFVPSEYGSWSASASVDVLALSGTLARANRGDGTFFVGKGGLAMEY
jgi:hypothetical protein